MNDMRTNRGKIANDDGLKKVMFFASNAKDALEIINMLLRAGYTVATGIMNDSYRGVRVYVWLRDFEEGQTNE